MRRAYWPRAPKSAPQRENTMPSRLAANIGLSLQITEKSFVSFKTFFVNYNRVSPPYRANRSISFARFARNQESLARGKPRFSAAHLNLSQTCDSFRKGEAAAFYNMCAQQNRAPENRSKARFLGKRSNKCIYAARQTPVRRAHILPCCDEPRQGKPGCRAKGEQRGFPPASRKNLLSAQKIFRELFREFFRAPPHWIISSSCSR